MTNFDSLMNIAFVCGLGVGFLVHMAIAWIKEDYFT